MWPSTKYCLIDASESIIMSIGVAKMDMVRVSSELDAIVFTDVLLVTV